MLFIDLDQFKRSTIRSATASADEQLLVAAAAAASGGRWLIDMLARLGGDGVHCLMGRRRRAGRRWISWRDHRQLRTAFPPGRPRTVPDGFGRHQPFSGRRRERPRPDAQCRFGHVSGQIIGRATACLHPEMTVPGPSERIQMENLRAAPSTTATIRVHLQPQVDTQAGRWLAPKRWYAGKVLNSVGH